MKLVWTKSKSPISIVIRIITGDDCSHFAFVFEKAAKGLMFHSNLLGTHPKFFQTAKKHFDIVHEKEAALPIELEDQLWDLIVEKYDGKPYDLGGVFYLGWRKILNRILKTPMPLKNKWASAEAFFCDELYEIFNSVPGFPKVVEGGGMDTPHDVWEKLKDWEYGVAS